MLLNSTTQASDYDYIFMNSSEYVRIFLEYESANGYIYASLTPIIQNW